MVGMLNEVERYLVHSISLSIGVPIGENWWGRIGGDEAMREEDTGGCR